MADILLGISWKETYNGNRFMKKYSVPLIFKEMQIENKSEIA